MSDLVSFLSTMRNCGRAFLNSAIPVLEEQQTAAAINLHDPIEDEIIGGLIARIFRFLQTFVLDYHLWAEDLGRSVLRMMLESLFYLRFLMEQDKHELFLEFQKYGIGQEKLYKMQLRKLIEDGHLKDSEELRDFINSESDEEIWDELVNVKLKNFEDVRKVASKAGLRTEYVLRYQPDSVVVHGHWPALRHYHLMLCTEPLHRSHLQPHFHLPPLQPELIQRALIIFGHAYLLWIGRYQLPDKIAPIVEQYLRCCEAIGEQLEQDKQGDAAPPSTE